MPRRGGPSTVWGILYQILGTLAEDCFVRLTGTVGDGDLHDATLIVEPEDGGDAQIHTTRATRIVQWKSRAGRRPWSLGDVVSEVLPDLYRATDVTAINRQYVFVTDGRRGAWPKAEQFFRSCQGPAPDNLPDCLDDTKRIGTIDRRGVTRRILFQRIVEEIRKHPPCPGEDSAVTCARLWRLLGHLEFE